MQFLSRLILVMVLISLTSTGDAKSIWTKEGWNHTRETKIDPIGDKAKEVWDKTREKHIDPIGDAESLKEGLKATGKAIVRTIKFTGEASWDIVETTYDVANDYVAKPIAKYFKENWDELQASQANNSPTEYVEKIRVVNELASSILITTGKTEHTNPKLDPGRVSIDKNSGGIVKLPKEATESIVGVFVKWSPEYCKAKGDYTSDTCWVRIHYAEHKLPFDIWVYFNDYNQITVQFDEGSLIKHLSK